MENNVPVQKNEEYIVTIIDYGCEGEGIAKINNFTVFIPGAMKEEKVKIVIVKVNTSHAFGKVLEIITPSKARQDTDCTTYQRCGGCNLRHMKYKETLELKKNMVQNLVDKSLKTKLIVKDTIGMEKPYHYRNKAQYPVGYNKNGEMVTGVYAKRSHEIIEINACSIQMPISEQIAKFILQWIKENGISAYNEKTGNGQLRHIIVKIGLHTGEVMCILVTNEKDLPNETKLVEALKQKFPEIKTIVKNINNKNTNVIMGKENYILYGNGYIQDKLGDFTFTISPLSFYQINPIQTEKLYHLAIEKANLEKKDIVLDLYCGIGTIGIFASPHVKQVYGIEVVEQAIGDAKENAKINKIQNIQFYCGDVEKMLEKVIQKEKMAPNVVFVDPPRKGLDEVTIRNIRKRKPERLIYISCNPATLMRDLKQLEEEYDIRELQPVDMFPFTSHVECVSVLNLKKTV
ncbi:MAG: 23S rRNA (uracil(1939)-C(5))-methyltransferase RlmD [Clostridia bacterium]|nr:23S rRNA (uracil(1939)-C(5))-methyltransferase RlmD [Clostridia bacterium]